MIAVLSFTNPGDAMDIGTTAVPTSALAPRYRTEEIFRDRWQKWEERQKSEKEFKLLLVMLAVWANEVAKGLPAMRRISFETELSVQFGYIFGTAIANNNTLDECCAELRKYANFL